MADRLQKLIAQSGLVSRRAAEALIVDGRVRINGRIVRELGTKADLHHDRVEVDGKRLVAERLVYYILHKPRGVVTTLEDPEGRDTIADLLRGIDERVFPVGRLDYHTSGALLVTNDGDLAQALLHPRKHVPKQYIAKMKGRLEIRELDALRNGVVLDDGYRTRKAELFVMREEGGNTWVHITITEGKNRQIHRMGMAIGRPVMRLSRIGFAHLTTEGLRPGDYRELHGHEVEKLQKDYALAVSTEGATQAAAARAKKRSLVPAKSKPAKSKLAKSKRSPTRARSSENERPVTPAARRPVSPRSPTKPTEANATRSSRPARAGKPVPARSRKAAPARSRKPPAGRSRKP